MLALTVRWTLLDATLDIEQERLHNVWPVSTLGTDEMCPRILEEVTTRCLGLPMPQPHVVLLTDTNNATSLAEFCASHW